MPLGSLGGSRDGGSLPWLAHPPNVRFMANRGPMARLRRRGEPAKLPGTDIYYGRVEHPAVDHWARKIAALALIVAVLTVGFTVTTLAWLLWAAGSA